MVYTSLDLIELNKAVRHCHKCPLAYRCHGAVPGVGPIGADIMCVGQAPGIEEDQPECHVPFIGQAGIFLTNHLERIGIDTMRRVYFTNLAKCFPGRRKGGDNEPPESSLTACANWLEQEIEMVQPRLIIAVGALAMHRLGIKGGGINVNSGKVFDTKYGKVMPILHPAGLMRMPSNIPIFATQLNAINTYLRGADIPPPYSDYEVWPF